MTIKNLRKTIVLVFLASLLSACATTKNISLEEKKQEIENFTLAKQPSTGEAHVYVVRPDTIGFAVRFKVYLDGKKKDGEYIGFTRGKQYLVFPVSTGKHVINSKAENWSSVEIDANDKEIIFIKQSPQIGLLFSRNNINRINSIDGKYFMKKYELEEGTYIEEEAN